MERRALGETGLIVSAVGLGCGSLGEVADAHSLVNLALDAGVTLFDTARSYEGSEEALGRALLARRAEAIISTKVGYGVEGHEDWAGACISAGIDRALRMLGTDWIDIVHLHSCPAWILERGEVLQALDAAVMQGKVRVAAYSGEEHDLDAAAASGLVRSLQFSVNICDQRSLAQRVPAFAARGFGVLAKRPLANAAWLGTGPYAERFAALAYDCGGMPWAEVAVRFAAFAPGVTSILIGTRSMAHLNAALSAVGQGPLPNDAQLRARFAALGAQWPGLI